MRHTDGLLSLEEYRENPHFASDQESGHAGAPLTRTWVSRATTSFCSCAASSSDISPAALARSISASSRRIVAGS